MTHMWQLEKSQALRVFTLSSSAVKAVDVAVELVWGVELRLHHFGAFTDLHLKPLSVSWMIAVPRIADFRLGGAGKGRADELDLVRLVRRALDLGGIGVFQRFPGPKIESSLT